MSNEKYNYQTIQYELNNNAKRYLDLIYYEYGKYFSKRQLELFVELKSKDIIKIETSSDRVFDVFKKDVLSNDLYTNEQKEKLIREYVPPIAHGGRTLEDGNIHIYPNVINGSKQMSNSDLLYTCDKYLVHELLHYFIQPEAINEKEKNLDGINSFTTEGLVDYKTRELQAKYQIHPEYKSNYGRNVIFIKDILKNKTNEEKNQLIFNGSISLIYENTSTDVFNSIEEYKLTKNKNSDFDNLIYNISSIVEGNVNKKDTTSTRFMYEVAANSVDRIDAAVNIEIATKEYVNEVVHSDIKNYIGTYIEKENSKNFKFEDKPKVLELKKKNSNTSNSGFASTLILTLLTGFTIGAIIMAIYVSIKF